MLYHAPSSDDGGAFFALEEEKIIENRVAVVSVIVQKDADVATVNDLLHQYAPYIIGRMGVPYRQRGVSIICVAVDGPADLISALSGKLGRLPGVAVKTVYAPAEALSGSGETGTEE